LSEKDGGSKGQPGCGKQMLAEPAGSTPVSQIMDEYAKNQSTWINDFIPTMEKMMRNGYSAGLSNAPDHNANVFCPIPVLAQPYYNTVCYQRSASTGTSFTIGCQLSYLNGRVYQYNATSGLFDFGLKSGAANQMWKMSESQTQCINQLTNLPLVVDANVEWTFQSFKGEMLITNPLTSLVIDCRGAGLSLPGKPCSTRKRNANTNQISPNL
jgi:hypothetical protein